MFALCQISRKAGHESYLGLSGLYFSARIKGRQLKIPLNELVQVSLEKRRKLAPLISGGIITSLAHGYDFFLYYFTLVITPMMLLSGVFFPLDQMPVAIQTGAWLLPLAHAVELVRPLMTGREVSGIALHLGVILLYLAVALPVAIALIRRRLMD